MNELLKGPHRFVLMLLISLPSLIALLITPALPLISVVYQVSNALSTLIISVYLLGYAFGQLLYGPLANRWGRKRALAIGLDLALVGTILCLFADQFWVLCVGRFLQALGAAAALKLTLTVIGGVHTGAGATRALSHVYRALSVLPGIGMVIGGLLAVSYGLEGCFAFITFYTLVLALLARTLPETVHAHDPHAFNFGRFGHRLAAQFKHSSFLAHALLIGLGTATVYLFFTEASFLSIELMGLNAESYGFWSIVPALGIAFGSFTAGQIAPELNPRVGILSGISTSLLGVLAMGILFANGHVLPASLFLTMTIIMAGLGITTTYAASAAFSVASDKSAGAAALGFTNLFLTMIVILGAGFLVPFSPMTFVGSFFILVVLQGALWLLLKSK